MSADAACVHGRAVLAGAEQQQGPRESGTERATHWDKLEHLIAIELADVLEGARKGRAFQRLRTGAQPQRIRAFAGHGLSAACTEHTYVCVCVMYVSVVRPDAEADLRAQRQELRDVCAE